MPSTYTLNNGIELIATGEQSGTWGDTTNTNLSLLDTALDGQVTVTLTSAGTSGSPNNLPITDGSASDGRNRMIIFNDGSDLGATAYVQLTPNDAEKIIYVRNDLSGSRSIILFQGTYSASNDYELPAGTTAVIYFDGAGSGAVAANVFNNAYFDSLRLGSVSVTAILDEDNMASDSATALATQQSIKAYVDTQVGANNELSEVLANGNTTGGTDIAVSTGDDITFADSSKAIFGTGSDLRIYHDGSNSYVEDNGVGNLNLKTNGAAVSILDASGYQLANFNSTSGEALLKHVSGGVSTTRLNTTATGINVTGEVQLDGSNNASDVDNVLRFKDTDTAVVADQKIGRIEFETSDTSNPGVNLQIDGIYGGSGAGSELVIRTGVAGSLENRMFIQDVETVFNEDSGDNDFRVESNSNTHMLFVDAGNNRIGINESSPQQTFHVEGNTRTDGVVNIHKADGTFIQTVGTSNNTGYINWESNGWTFYTNGPLEGLRIGSSGLVVNEDSRDYDFRVESSNHSYALFMNGANGGVQMGGSSQTSVGTPGEGRLALIRSNGSTQLNMYRDDATISAGDTLGIISAYSNHTTSSAVTRLAKIEFAADGAFSAGDNPTKIAFYTTEDATEADREIAKFDNRGTLYVNRGGVFNEAGSGANNADFRVESDGASNMLFVDAANDAVGIKTGSPSTDLHVAGTGRFERLQVTDDGSSSPLLNIKADDASPWAFQMQNDTYNTSETYGFRGYLDVNNQAFFQTNSNGAYTYIEFQQRDNSTTRALVSLGKSGATVFNESGADIDFRVESATDSHMFFIDAANEAIGIGTSAPSQALDSAKQLVVGAKSGDNGITINSGTSGVGRLIFSDGTSGTSLYAGYFLYDHSSNEFNIGTNGSERMKIGTGEVIVNEQSQNLDFRVESDTYSHMFFVDAGNDRIGMNSSAPEATLHINDTGTTFPGIFFENASNTEGDITWDSSETLQVGTWNQSSDTFTQLMTINSAGRVNFAQTGDIEIGRAHDQSTYDSGERLMYIFAGAVGNQTLIAGRNAADGSPIFRGQVSSTTRAEIEANGDFLSATNSYGSTSDQTLKENIVASGSQWDDLKAVQVKKFSYIRDDLDAANMIGVIAQDLEASGMSGLVSSMDQGDGTMVKTVKYSVLYMKAIKALQEAMERIETLETKVAALENT